MQWKVGDLAQVADRLVQVMYEPTSRGVLVRDVDMTYRKMSMSDLWLFASAGDGNAVAEIRHRSDPSTPVPLPGWVVSFVDVAVLQPATVEELEGDLR